MSHQVVVLDFETTGLSPRDSRVIEVAALKVDKGEVIGSVVQLMHPGFPIPPYITGFTGIDDAMVRGMPSPEAMMPRLHAFIGDWPVVAHNASFDLGFLRAEMARAGLACGCGSLCTMRLARRLVPGLGGYALARLVDHLGLVLPSGERFHRALGDALVTVELWNRLVAIIEQQHGIVAPEIAVLDALMKVPKRRVPRFFEDLSRPQAGSGYTGRRMTAS